MNDKQKKLLMRIIGAAVMMVILTVLPLKKVPALRFILYLVPYFIVGHDILRKAFKGIKNRQVFDENFLMAVATVGAMALGEYTEGVAVMLFYQIGEFFQGWAVGKSRRNISELMDIRPDYANLETEDGIERPIRPMWRSGQLFWCSLENECRSTELSSKESRLWIHQPSPGNLFPAISLRAGRS